MEKIRGILGRWPIIAAVRDVNRIREASNSPVQSIFLMTGDIFSIEECVRIARTHHKSIFLHVDLIKGVANDREGIQYLARCVKPDGVVSTKSQIIRVAKKEGLLAIQHLFMIDTHAFQTGIRNIQESEPHAIELMPGLMPRVIRDLAAVVSVPIVTGGLVKTREEIQAALQSGAVAVAIGDPGLWGMDATTIRPEELV
ncbi:glycerol-3-phosphate responsive antiterminator [Bacillaceae bacterium]